MDWTSAKRGGVNIALRFATMMSKFLLVFLLAKYLPTKELGLYGIFFATVGFSLYLVGFDFYSFSIRDILGRERSTWYAYCRQQFKLYLCSYLIGLPLFLLLFSFGFLPWHLSVWFFLLLILGHIGTELYRLLVATGAPILASWSMFVRVGAWAYLLGGLCWYDPALLKLDYIWPAWVAGEILGVCLALWGLRELREVCRGELVDGLAWIRQGLVVALPLFLGTIAMRGIYTVDRYILDFFAGREAVGVFALFMGLAVSLQSFVESGVVSIYYPDIVISYKQGDFSRYREGLKKMRWAILLVLGVYCACSFVFLDLILSLIGKREFIDYSHIFWILLGSVGILSLSSVYHFALYSMGFDRAIVMSTVVAFLSFLVFCFLLVPGYGLVGLATAHLLVMGEIFVMKYLAHRKVSACMGGVT